MRAQKEKTTISCKDDCTLMNYTRAEHYRRHSDYCRRAVIFQIILKLKKSESSRWGGTKEQNILFKSAKKLANLKVLNHITQTFLTFFSKSLLLNLI